MPEIISPGTRVRLRAPETHPDIGEATGLVLAVGDPPDVLRVSWDQGRVVRYYVASTPKPLAT